MKTYLPNSTKSGPVKQIIEEALEILESIGIPLQRLTETNMEKMAMSFLALVDVTEDWGAAKSAEDNYGLTSKNIIRYFNEKFEDNTSVGSYDDVPRRFIKLLLVADFVVRSGINPTANYNSPMRKYAVPKFLKDLIIHYKTSAWEAKLAEFNMGKTLLVDELKRVRHLSMLPVLFEDDGEEIYFTPGGHNSLQKMIIEEFLPRFGGECKVLYMGDGANRSARKLDDELKKLHFFDLSHGMLPDIVAFSEKYNWLFLIEAFYSTGTIDEVRMKQLKKNLENCSSEIIFVTAFLTKAEFKKQILNIAWESEVWIAEDPDHLVHFNGHKFLGAMQNSAT